MGGNVHGTPGPGVYTRESHHPEEDNRNMADYHRRADLANLRQFISRPEVKWACSYSPEFYAGIEEATHIVNNLDNRALHTADTDELMCNREVRILFARLVTTCIAQSRALNPSQYFPNMYGLRVMNFRSKVIRALMNARRDERGLLTLSLGRERKKLRSYSVSLPTTIGPFRVPTRNSTFYLG